MASFLISLFFIIIIVYLVNFKNELDVRDVQYRALQKKTENQINDILKRLKLLENNGIKPSEKQIVPENVYNIEQPKNIIEQTNNIIEPEEHQIADMTQFAQEVENAVENHSNLPPQPQIDSHPHIEKAVSHSQFIPEPNPHQVQSSDSIDLEKLFLGNVFSKIGGIALVLAICFLVKLTSEYIEFTPVMKISMGYIASIGLLVYSLFLYKKENSLTAQILSGVSISGLLLSTYFACFMYELFPIPVALIIAFIIALSSYFISEKFNSFSTIAIGLLGGYLNPAAFNENISISVLFGYLIALNLISVCYTYKNGTMNKINCINIALTLATLIIFSSRGEVSIIFPILLWLLYVGYDILTTLKKSKQSDSALLRWFNFAVLIYLTNHIFHFTDKIPIGSTIIAVGLIYGILYFVFKYENEDIKITNLQSGLLCLFMGTGYLVNYPYLALAWTVEGYLVSEIYLKLNKSFLRNYVFLFIIPAFIYLFFNYLVMFSMDEPSVLIFTFVLYLAQASVILYTAKRIGSLDNYMKNILYMLGFSILYLYAIFFANSGSSDTWTKLYIDVILACIYSLHSYKLLSKDFKEFGLLFGECLYGLAIILLIIAEGLALSSANYIPFFNLEFLSYITLLALTVYYHKVVTPVFGYISVVLGLFSLIGQLNYIFTPIFPSETMPLVITVSLIIYSGIILTVGILNNLAFMKQTSICLILLLLCKLVLVDLADIDAIFKLIAFVIIGIILLGVSSYYQKRK